MLQLPSFRSPQTSLVAATLAFIIGGLAILAVLWLIIPFPLAEKNSSIKNPTAPTPQASSSQTEPTAIDEHIDDLEQRIESLRAEWQDFATTQRTSTATQPPELAFLTLAVTLTTQIATHLNEGRPFTQDYELLLQLSSRFGESWHEALSPLQPVAESPLPSPSSLLSLIDSLPLPTPTPTSTPSAEERPSIGRFLASLISIEKVDPHAVTAARHPLLTSLANGRWQDADAILKTFDSKDEAWSALHQHVLAHITANRHLSVLRSKIYDDIEKALMAQIEASEP